MVFLTVSQFHIPYKMRFAVLFRFIVELKEYYVGCDQVFAGISQRDFGDG